MDPNHHHHHNHQISPSSSTSSSSDPNHNHQSNHHNSTDPTPTWWESISKARTRIHLLSTILTQSEPSISSLADSDCPARSLLLSPAAHRLISAALSAPTSGSGDDPLCHWLYDTYLSSDPDLRLVVLSFVPILSSLYLARIHTSLTFTKSLSGFEAVILAIYTSETKSRAGKAVVANIPDLNQPSLYHTPRAGRPRPNPNPSASVSPSFRMHNVGVLCPPLEAQNVIKSTKRGIIVGVVLDCYFKQIAQMPSWSKLELCKFATVWAGEECLCCSEFDRKVDPKDAFSDGIVRVEEIEEVNGVIEKMEKLDVEENVEREGEGKRIPLPWEMLQPVLRILGHCLLAPLIGEDVKDAASVAVRRLYARACHDLVPQAILATRSLIQLDNRGREAAANAAAVNAASNANTPSKAKKPEILLVSK